MRRDRLAATVLAGAALLALAPPSAADTPSGGWTDPAPHTSHQDVPVAFLDRIRSLTGTATFEGGIAAVSFTLVDAPDPTDECSAAEEVLPQSAPGGGNRVDFSFEAPFPCNRRYQVRARIEPQQRPLRNDSALVLNLLVDVAVPPPPTAGVAAEVRGREVTVRWQAGPQAPDFEGFQIQRASGDGGFSPIGEAPVDATSFRDADVPDGGGALRYQVVGMRPGPEAGTTVFGESGGVATVEVAGEPGAVGSGGSGGGGGGSRSGTVVRRSSGASSGVRRSTTNTTVDTGYQEALPFDSASPLDPVSPPAGDPAVVARVDGDDEEGRRQTLLLVAGGTTAFSWAMLLRFLNRRALVL